MVRLYFLLILGLALVAGRNVKEDSSDSEDEELYWPKEYHVKITRISLTAHFIEDYEIWKTKHQSRTDYNNGAVKSITMKNKHFRRGIRYTKEFEANDDQDVTSACYIKNGNSGKKIYPDSLMPDTNGFKTDYDEDYEIVNDKQTEKFTGDESNESGSTKKTIWAYFDNETSNWVPVKYEAIAYNDWNGVKMSHEIWMFYNFSTSLETDEVFTFDDSNCTEEDDDDEDDEDNLQGHRLTKDLISIDPENDDHVNHVFEAFKRDFSRTYNDKAEHALRKSIFKNTLKLVATTNSQNLGYKLTINKFADRTPEDMKKHTGLRKRPQGKTGAIAFPYSEDKIAKLAEELPTEYDARLDGLVSDVKDQDECGSCWTFGTTAAVEGALAKINGGTLITLSNQALIDCAWPYGASGCNGGTDNAAYEWMIDYGLPTVAEYGEYLNQDGECRIKNMTKKYPIRGFTDVTPENPEALKIALLNHGPLSVSVHVSDKLKLYKSGIFYDIDCTNELNHEVTLVGYGERDGEPFWVIKNSWGTSWGVDGYMYISARDNNCGITTEPTYVVF